ncbi:MAG: hypothetical protein COX90_01800 [Candidatus Nealsonbacteria bacterium CG_4_10_14_0_2_um_filter_38_17]|uniref:MurNAc-LAA domain-containing protein n=2 Tax=Candidatus Nealsoniibacteriota TaxID=1817911 RepID=A0A2M7UYK8_9BACT|nr:MAG: hypothetical protein COX36_04420 [Candidatus Nealsonbacteria bacterium CG23_combo_of_CG06-09_8_20_14_all_38_19]PIZ88955.1 MAG: hypothetical protein COX90_01800 [Candidatus Nealsonbacteria bacterium CG_4_10_14_0_2_um_filter_38_17]
MGKIKIGLITLSSLALVGLVIAGVIFAQTNPLQDKIIALDAGHGGEKLGAQYPATCADDGDPSDCKVYEKDVNLAVVYTLKNKLETNGAKVVLSRLCDETITSNKERVDLAVERCKSLYGKKCDALVSVHHNGSTVPTYDGTMVIYNERQDLPLAKALLEKLVPLTGNNEGLAHGGYGMTVYDHLVSALTEAYYITNTGEANQYLSSTLIPVSQYDTSSTCNYQVRFGNRTDEEATALHDGLFNYFNSSSGNGGGKPDVPPGQNK